MTMVSRSATEDCIANRVLQECCQDIVNHINVDLVLLPLYSKTWLTIQEVDHLQTISTAQEKKRLLYIHALAGKGSVAFKDMLAILNDTGAYYKPHADLSVILRNYHSRLSAHDQYVARDHRDKYSQTQEVKMAPVKARKETTIDSINIQLGGEDDEDVDHRTEYSYCPSSLDTAQSIELHSLRLRTKQKVRTSAGNPSSSHVSPSFGYINDHATGQPVSPIKDPATSLNTNRMSSRMDQSQRTNINRARSTIKESGFFDAVSYRQSSVLIKSQIPLPDMLTIKLILLGDSGVGKTSLAQRYLSGMYYDKSPTTVGTKHDECYCEHTKKRINVRLSVWDTAGQERFAWMYPLYYHNSHGAIVVFDMTRPGTLHSASIWKRELSRHLVGDDAIPVLLVGNKCDLPEVSRETRRHAQRVAESFDGYFEASAKDNLMVENVFEKAVTLVIDGYQQPLLNRGLNRSIDEGLGSMLAIHSLSAADDGGQYPADEKPQPLNPAGYQSGDASRLEYKHFEITDTLPASKVTGNNKSQLQKDGIPRPRPKLERSPHSLGEMILLKLILLGNNGVGKQHSCIDSCTAFIMIRCQPLIGGMRTNCYLTHDEKKVNVELAIWDTAGQERFNCVSPSFYRKVDIAIMMFDMTDDESRISLHSVEDWNDQLINCSNKQDIPVILVGSKCESLAVNKSIRRHAEHMVTKLGFHSFMEVAAKTNYQVEALFQQAVDLALVAHVPQSDPNMIQVTQQTIRPRRKSCNCFNKLLK